MVKQPEFALPWVMNWAAPKMGLLMGIVMKWASRGAKLGRVLGLMEAEIINVMGLM